MSSSLYKCPKCELNFLSKDGMEKHAKRVHENKAPKVQEKDKGVTRFKCEHCNEEFTSKPDFKNHKLNQKLLCKKCQEKGSKFVCQSKCELIKHVRTVHRNDLMKKKEAALLCQKCHKVLKTVQQLKTHQESLSVLACTRCNQKVAGFCNLELHLKNSCLKADSAIKTEHIPNQERKQKKEREQPRRKEKPQEDQSQTGDTSGSDQHQKSDESQTSPWGQVDFFYPTFTSQQLIDAGVFDTDSPSQFELQSPPDLQMETSEDFIEPEIVETYQPAICDELVLGF